jgi:membrane-bound serine protease (ClpP class)
VAIGMPGADPEPAAKPDRPAGKSDGKGADGKAEPVVPTTGDALRAKQVNDAAAYIRGLAELRGRNVEWAEDAVRKAVSLSAAEALKLKVIDLIAPDIAGLQQALDGRRVEIGGRTVTLATRDAPVLTIAPDARMRFLAALTHPSVALVLMLIGVYGLFFEFSSPGLGVAGVAGAICLLLGLYSLHLLPVSYAGLGLLLLGLALMVAEMFAPSFGVLGIGGVLAFVLGATLLIDTEVPGFGIPLPLIVALALTSVTLIVFVGGAAWRARRARVVSGREEMIGATGEVIDADGWAQIHGERWRVRSAEPLAPGRTVRVRAVDGLTLEVDPIEPTRRAD